MKQVLKFFSIVMMLAVIGVSLAACGKISSPEPIENGGYPHSYPRR